MNQIITLGFQQVGAAKFLEALIRLSIIPLGKRLLAGNRRICTPAVARKCRCGIKGKTELGQPIIRITALIDHQTNHFFLCLLLALVSGVAQPVLIERFRINQIFACGFGSFFFGHRISPVGNLSLNLAGHIQRHRAAGKYGSTAKLAGLVDCQNGKTVLRRTQRSRRTGTAHTDDKHLCIQLNGLVILLWNRLESLNRRSIAAARCQRLRERIFNRLTHAVAGGGRPRDSIHRNGLMLNHARDHTIYNCLKQRRFFRGVDLINFNRSDFFFIYGHINRQRLADAEPQALAGIGAGRHFYNRFRVLTARLRNAILHSAYHSFAGEGCARYHIHLCALRVKNCCGQFFCCHTADAARLIWRLNLHIRHALLIKGHAHTDHAAKALGLRRVRSRRIHVLGKSMRHSRTNQSQRRRHCHPFFH